MDSEHVSPVHNSPESSVPSDAERLDELSYKSYTLFRKSGNTSHLIAAKELLEQALLLMEKDHPDRPLAQAKLIDYLNCMFEKTYSTSWLVEAQRLGEKALQEISADSNTKERAIALTHLANTWELMYNLTDDMKDLIRAIDLSEGALELITPSHELYFLIASTLANELESRCSRLREPSDIERAITLAQSAYDSTAPDDEEKPWAASNLSVKFSVRYKILGNISDLEKAIALCNEAIDKTEEGSPGKSIRLRNLASLLSLRYDEQKEMADLRRSIDSTKLAILSLPPNEMSRLFLLNDLAYRYEKAFDGDVDMNDLAESIRWSKIASYNIVSLPSEIQERPKYRATWSELQHRLVKLAQIGYKETGNSSYLSIVEWSKQHLTGFSETQSSNIPSEQSDGRDMTGSDSSSVPQFDDSINRDGRANKDTAPSSSLDSLYENFDSARRELLAHQAEDNANPWSQSLATAKNRVLEASTTLRDVDNSIRHFKAIIFDSKPDDPTLGGLYDFLGTLHIMRFKLTGELVCIDEAIAASTEAVVKTTINDYRRTWFLNNLGTHYISKFEKMGETEDLQKAVTACEAAVAACPMTVEDRVTSWDNLAVMLWSRFKRMGSVKDLERAISISGECVPFLNEIESPETEARVLSNLSNYLASKFEITSDLVDIDQAIHFIRRALQIGRGKNLGIDPRFMNNLSNQLAQRYYESERDEDLDESIEWGKKALDNSDDSDINLIGRKHNLAGKLGSRFAKKRNDADSRLAIKLEREVLSKIPTNDLNRTMYMKTLAGLLRESAEDDRSKLDEALDLYRQVAFDTTATPSRRINAAGLASNYILLPQKRYKETSDLLEASIEAIQVLSPGWLESSDRERLLGTVAGIPADAAAAAILAGKGPQRALEILELSRGVIIGSVIDTRVEISGVDQLDHDLYQNFVEICKQLNETEGTNVDASITFSEETDGNPVSRRKQKVNTWEELRRRIRCLSGYERFQLPPTLEELAAIGNKGPVVYIFFSKIIDKGFCIIVEEHETSVLELPSMSFEQIVEHFVHLDEIAYLSKGGIKTYHARTLAMIDILQWTWDAAVHPILSKLNLLQQPTANSLQRVWWIGVGLLSRFPFHAAGDYSVSPPTCTSQFVMSSYIPSIKSLLFARSKEALNFIKKDLGLMVITMPQTPGYANLNAVEKEGEEINSICTNSVSCSRFNKPSSKLVLEEFKNCNLFHFAGHGIMVQADPSQSHLLLCKKDQNGNELVDRLTVESIRSSNATTNGIAYLSACVTAENASVELADEALQLSSAFQLAGFSHVLGTVFNAQDRICIQVAKAFYGNLFDGTRDENGHARVALSFHQAVEGVRRKRPSDPLSWAPFVHIGA